MVEAIGSPRIDFGVSFVSDDMCTSLLQRPYLVVYILQRIACMAIFVDLYVAPWFRRAQGVSLASCCLGTFLLACTLSTITCGGFWFSFSLKPMT